MDIQERFTAFANLGAEWVLWLLVFLSVVSIAVMIERAVLFAGLRADIAKLREDLSKLLRKDDLDGAVKMLSASKAAEAQVLVAGIREADRGAASAEEAMAGASKEVRLRLEKNLAYLGTVGNNAPFVGLFGTCLGIIKALPALSDPSGTGRVIQEISQALVATAIGLLVAIPAVAAYNYFQRLTKTRLARGDALGHVVLAYLKAGSGGGRSEPAEAAGDDPSDEEA